jgi:hypothetical protein
MSAAHREVQGIVGGDHLEEAVRHYFSRVSADRLLARCIRALEYRVVVLEERAGSAPPLAEPRDGEPGGVAELVAAYRDLDRKLTKHCPVLPPEEYRPIQDARNRVASLLHKLRPVAPSPAAPEAPAGEPETEGREVVQVGDHLFIAAERKDRIEDESRGGFAKTPGRWYPQAVADRLECEAGEAGELRGAVRRYVDVYDDMIAGRPDLAERAVDTAWNEMFSALECAERVMAQAPTAPAPAPDGGEEGGSDGD